MQRRRCLKDIILKKHKTIIGLNSGTSADGIDAAVIKVSGCGLKSKVNFITGSTYKYKPHLKRRILEYAQLGFINGVKWLELDIELAKEFALACKKIAKKAKLSISDIDFIGSHGQTVRHLPRAKGKSITYQVADPSRIAVLTGISTIGDFRSADISAGGQGAPLTPIVNAILFGEKKKTVGVLNIGGIANISSIEFIKGGFELFGCDTGPGNMIIDYLAKKLYGQDYDKGGKLALSGKVDNSLINGLLKSKFFNIRGTKSTGREQFGKEFSELFLNRAGKKGLNKRDILATATHLTVKAVEKCVKLNRLKLDLIIITGGGAKNRFIINRLKESLSDIEFKYASDYGYPGDFLEAISFAILANETTCSNRYNLKNVTGATRETILGKICPV